MVSNARLDFPDPLTPVTTVSLLIGICTLMFLRLWTRAPRTLMSSSGILSRLFSMHVNKEARMRTINHSTEARDESIWDGESGSVHQDSPQRRRGRRGGAEIIVFA